MNNEELCKIRTKQINMYFFTKFGKYGEKIWYWKKLIEFLLYIYNNTDSNSNFLVVSHDSTTSYTKRILGVESIH